jgi:hypothetical protein
LLDLVLDLGAAVERVGGELGQTSASVVSFVSGLISCSGHRSRLDAIWDRPNCTTQRAIRVGDHWGTIEQ